MKNGAGGFCPPDSWFYVPWPQLIRDNRENSSGVRFKHKLSCLEGFAALAGLTMVPNKLRNREATILCDNAGFVAIYKKKRSKCEYAYTMAKAIYDVGSYLGCKVNVEKIRRCSDPNTEAADALSKGDWQRAWANMPEKETDPQRTPRVLLRWIANPYPDLNLGRKIIEEMSQYTDVLLEA